MCWRKPSKCKVILVARRCPYGADNTFKLKIVASNRVFYDGRAQTLVIPAIDGGEVGFLAQHENCVTPVEVGECALRIPRQDHSRLCWQRLFGVC